MDGLVQRLDNDLKDDCSRVLVPIGMHTRLMPRW